MDPSEFIPSYRRVEWDAQCQEARDAGFSLMQHLQGHQSGLKDASLHAFRQLALVQDPARGCGWGKLCRLRTAHLLLSQGLFAPCK
eukprot:5310923-Pyramimonas_sp.AAC.1